MPNWPIYCNCRLPVSQKDPNRFYEEGTDTGIKSPKEKGRVISTDRGKQELPTYETGYRDIGDNSPQAKEEQHHKLLKSTKLSDADDFPVQVDPRSKPKDQYHLPVERYSLDCKV